MAREWLLLKDRLHLRTEPIEAAPHIAHAGSNPDLRPGRKLDHFCRLSRTARTRDRSAPLSTLIIAKPGKLDMNRSTAWLWLWSWLLRDLLLGFTWGCQPNRQQGRTGLDQLAPLKRPPPLENLVG